MNFTTIADLSRYVSDLVARAKAPEDGIDAGVKRVTEMFWGFGVKTSGEFHNKINNDFGEDGFWDIYEGK